MPFTITIRDDISLSQLLAQMRAGVPVIKTPHVGNFYPNNLAMAQLDIFMKKVDHTKGEKDRNFHPHRIVRGGKNRIVSCERRLSTHTRLTCQETADELGVEIGARMLDVHTDYLRRAIPNYRGIPWSKMVQEHAEFLEKILEVITGLFPEVWERRVNADGITVLATASSWQDVKRYGVFNIHSKTEGFLIPNVVDILIDPLLDGVHLAGENKTFHLSGPDMVRYIGKLMPQLEQLYAGLRSRTGDDFPERVEMDMIGVSDMRFAVPERERGALNDLVEAYLARRQSAAAWAPRLRSAKPEERQPLIDAKTIQHKQIGAQIRTASEGCPSMFYDIYEGNYYSQYDMVRDGEPLYIHPWALEAPIGEVSKAYREIAKVSGRN